MHKKPLATGVRPGQQGRGELTALPHPLAGFKAALRGGEGQGREVGEGKGQKGARRD